MTLDHKDFFDWIRQQPDDKPVNMREASNKDPCGCLLVQYGRHLNLKFTLVGYDTIGFSEDGGYSKFLDPDMMVWDLIIAALNNNIKTFKEAKELYDTTKS